MNKKLGVNVNQFSFDIQVLTGYLVIIYRNTDNSSRRNSAMEMVPLEEGGKKENQDQKEEKRGTTRKGLDFQTGILLISYTITVLNALAFILASVNKKA